MENQYKIEITKAKLVLYKDSSLQNCQTIDQEQKTQIIIRNEKEDITTDIKRIS